ncbi:hypothetical protein ILYODFUR_035180 [Ilyodon furcidens]|uniref:Uncharacterized protein n=1 Tax=Ilyodon furcidens TaxID=33524 RepID=A0ABV0SRR0_9TELE
MKSTERCGLLCKAWLCRLELHGPCSVPLTTGGGWFHHPAVLKGPLDSRYCFSPLCRLPNLFFPFLSTFVHHLSSSLIDLLFKTLALQSSSPSSLADSLHLAKIITD